MTVSPFQVRPEEEVRIARVSGAVNVPLFRVDKSVAPGSLIKQMSAFGMGGWWLGTKHMVANTQVRTDMHHVLFGDNTYIRL